ncbi:MAG TPA: RNA polymerase sigma factor [Solirubrobacteraceae bacterium]|jgi:RNA polymerase sigma-70 factor (ECF subfamily)
MRLNRLPLRRVRDAQLIARAGDDPVGFSELYTRHAVEIHAWLSRRLEWAASDLTAETFARALLNRHRFQDTHQGSALPWLLGIARNVLLETVRADRIETRARERLGLPLDLATEDGFTEVEDRLSPRLLLNGQLETLPVGERDALRLRVIEELTYDEVAERLDIRPTAARLRVSRALRRLAHTTPEENT